MKSAVCLGRVLCGLILAGVTTIAAAGPTHSVTLTPSSTSYSAAGGRITFTVTLSYSEASLGGLGVQLVAPTGWKFVSAVGGVHVPDVAPSEGQIGNLPFAYVKVPASPVSFLFTMSYPAGLTGNQVFTAVRANFTDETTGNAALETVPNITIPPATTAMILPRPARHFLAQMRGVPFSATLPVFAWTKGASKS